MSRRKRYIKYRIFVTNDAILVKSNPKKRRVVVVNNDKNNAFVMRILSASGGRNAKHGIKIEKYPDVPKDSVVEKRVRKKTVNNKPINTKRMRKTKSRLNKWDAKKIEKK